MAYGKDDYRVEQDELGEVQIPVNALWGAKTARAKIVFGSLGTRPHGALIDAAALIKKTYASANAQAGRFDLQIARMIGQACDEILNGQWRDQFVIDLAAGAWVFSANLNEVIANRTLQILGHEPGKYQVVDPSRHVGAGQSANDVFSSAARIAALFSLRNLEPSIRDLERLLRRKSLEFDRIQKPTSSEDSASLSLGQEFNAYGSLIQRSHKRILEASKYLLELSLPDTYPQATAAGKSEIAPQLVQLLNGYTGLRLSTVSDACGNKSISDFVLFSSSLKELAIELNKIANDMRRLAPSPDACSVVAAVNMVAYEVMSNDAAICLAAQSGRMDAAPMATSMIGKLLSSMDVIAKVIAIFNQHCVQAICEPTQQASMPTVIYNLNKQIYNLQPQ